MGIRLKKGGHFAARVIHAYKMGFFQDNRNSKAADLSPPPNLLVFQLIC
jgi:hypothetical protein